MSAVGGARWIRTATLVLATASIGVAGCSSTPAPSASKAPVHLTVSRAACGAGWTHPHGGIQTFRIRNTGIATAEVRLIRPRDSAVYAELDSLAGGATAYLRVRLGRGRYAFQCFPEEGAAVTGETVTVSDGPQRGAPAVAAVSEQDLHGAVRAYRAHVVAGLSHLRRDVATLNAVVGSGDRAAARRAWLPAHLDYERLGAAYGAFGARADAIDGLPAGLRRGVHDPEFTGFHRIERGLWHGAAMRAVAGWSRRLVRDVRRLTKDFATARIDPNDLSLRAHEIMEQSLEFELTGRADQGSGTSLATARANVDGTYAVLDALRPVLRDRYRGLGDVDRSLARVRGLLEAQRRHGRWTPVSSLERPERERLDGAVGQLLERLAPIATIAEVRRSR